MNCIITFKVTVNGIVADDDCLKHATTLKMTITPYWLGRPASGGWPQSTPCRSRARPSPPTPAACSGRCPAGTWEGGSCSNCSAHHHLTDYLTRVVNKPSRSFTVPFPCWKHFTASLSVVLRSWKRTKLLHTSGACPGDGSYYYWCIRFLTGALLGYHIKLKDLQL